MPNNTKYIITGGGFYIGVMNDRTKQYRWVNKQYLEHLKKTDRTQLTLEEAENIKAKNEQSYMKMANVLITPITEGAK